ncbi:MAG: STAS/SEC14 domain-containing protein [Deltaproteobacteria bacterium]|nr:STAS/SEC14 domain-containing protein [Deltaproteobacteria bacterium]
MACEILRIDGEIVHIRLKGIMKPTDLQSLQTTGKQLIGQGVKPRLLVTLDDFQGWEKGVDWNDVGFMLTQGKNILKMAIVGDERWKEDVFAFVAKGLRPTEIEFFAPSAAKDAESWIRA